MSQLFPSGAQKRNRDLEVKYCLPKGKVEGKEKLGDGRNLYILINKTDHQ